jgi:hypothetical protein
MALPPSKIYISGECLLILDSRVSMQRLNFYYENKIDLLRLPQHVLQPLDCIPFKLWKFFFQEVSAPSPKMYPLLHLILESFLHLRERNAASYGSAPKGFQFTVFSLTTLILFQCMNFPKPSHPFLELLDSPVHSQ